MIKRSVHRKDVVILNSYALSNRASKYMKQKLIELKRDINRSIIIVRTIVSVPLC